MSSTESAQIPGSDISSEKSLKSVESNRFMSSTAQVRSVSTQSLTRLTAPTTYTSVSALGHLTLQKQGGHRTLSNITTVPLNSGTQSTPKVTSVTTSTYHVPRGAAQVASIASRPSNVTIGRTQPIASSPQTTIIRTASPGTLTQRASSPMQQNSWLTTPSHISNVITIPRGVSPSVTAPRTTTLSTYGTTKTITMTVATPNTKSMTHHQALTNRAVMDGGKQILLQSIPAKPMSLAQGNQLHTVTDKGIKMTSGTVSQVMPLRSPGTVPSSSTATFLTQTQGPPILQTQVRLTVPSASQPPLLATQRVAVSATNAVLSSRIATPITSICGGVALSNTARLASGISQGAIIATTRLAPGSGTVLPAQGTPARLVQTVTGPSTILATPARIASFPTPIVTGQPAIIASSTRIAGTGAALISTNTRATSMVSQAGLLSTTTPIRSQPAASLTATSTSVVTTTATRFTVSSSSNRVAVTTSIQHQLLTTSPRLTSPGNIVVPSQLVVNTTAKPVTHSTNISGRPMAIHNSNIGPKVNMVITQPIHTPVQVSQTQMVGAKPSNQQGTIVSSSQTTITSVTPKQSLVSTTQDSERTTLASTLSTYTLPGSSYFYEAPSGYQLATDAPLVARPLATDAPLITRQLSTDGPLIARPYTPGTSTFVTQPTSTNARATNLPTHGLITTSQTMRYNPVMIVDPLQTTFTNDNATLMISETGTVSKLTSSPRPSILRKRENESSSGGGSPSKVSKNLTPLLSAISRSASPSPPSLQLETNQNTNDNGPSSNGSTTISATSSPGLDDKDDNSMSMIKSDVTDEIDRPAVEMSPRKKPRKQQLNDAIDSSDMEFISDERIKKETDEEIVKELFFVNRPKNYPLFQPCKHTWRARHNHFLRYSDVRSKLREPTVAELSNEKHVLKRLNGWKIYIMSASMENFIDMESQTLDTLDRMLDGMKEDLWKDVEVNRACDLFMGTMQRSKLIKDQTDEAKLQLTKLFEHKAQIKELVIKNVTKNCKKK